MYSSACHPWELRPLRWWVSLTRSARQPLGAKGCSVSVVTLVLLKKKRHCSVVERFRRCPSRGCNEPVWPTIRMVEFCSWCSVTISSATAATRWRVSNGDSPLGNLVSILVFQLVQRWCSSGSCSRISDHRMSSYEPKYTSRRPARVWISWSGWRSIIAKAVSTARWRSLE